MIDPIQQELGRTAPYTPTMAHPAHEPRIPAANLTYAYAGFGAVLGILFGVATAATLHQSAQTSQIKPAPAPAPAVVIAPAVVQASFTAPEEKDMGSVSSREAGLRGHLTTSWSERLGYHLVLSPSDPAAADAFALTVSEPVRPISVDLQLKAAAGQVLCDQNIVVKYDPSKGAAGKDSAQLGKLQAQELDRERASDVFQNDVQDGKVASISSTGTIPCSKQDYETAAYWSFTPQFPDLRQQEARLHKQNEVLLAKNAAPAAPQLHTVVKTVAAQHTSSEQRIAAEMKLTASAPKAAAIPRTLAVATPAPAAPASIKTADVAEVQKPAAFHFQIEGDDEIVDFDAAQKSLETSAGKTFFVSETLAASNVASWLDVQANVHYRCDETSSCTLSLASTTLLHATMRNHRSTLAQPEMLSQTSAQETFDAPAGPVSLGH